MGPARTVGVLKRLRPVSRSCLLEIFRGEGAVQKGPEAASCMLQGFRWFGTVFQQVAGEEGMVFHI